MPQNSKSFWLSMCSGIWVSTYRRMNRTHRYRDHVKTDVTMVTAEQDKNSDSRVIYVWNIAAFWISYGIQFIMIMQSILLNQHLSFYT